MATPDDDQPPLSPPLPKYLQEPEMTQECRDLISTLPTQRGWVGETIHQYQGFWFETVFMQGVVAFQKHFRADRDTDILLATIPKAGTTWLKAISFALVNRLRYPDTQQHPLLTVNPHILVPSLEINLYNKKRNPKDTFVSFWHFSNKLRPMSIGALSLEDAFDMFCRGSSGFGPYWDHVLGYWEESIEKPEKVLFLKYEEMKEQPIANLRRLADFLGCPFSPEEEAKGVVNDISRLCSFNNLRNLEVNKSGKGSLGQENNIFFRRGQVGDWMNYLTAEMIKKLDRITEEKFHGTGLRF